LEGGHEIEEKKRRGHEIEGKKTLKRLGFTNLGLNVKI